MTPKIIALKQAPVVLVELNENYSYPDTIGIGNNETDTLVMELSTGNCMSIGLNLRVLGILSDLTEEQFAECVKQGLGLYANYNETVEFGTAMRFEKASESFYSLLESEKVYTENPYRHPDEIYTNRDDSNIFQKHSMKKWHEAQSRTIDPTRTIVLLKK